MSKNDFVKRRILKEHEENEENDSINLENVRL